GGDNVYLWDADTGKRTEEIKWVEYGVPTLIGFPKNGELLGVSAGRTGGNETIDLLSGKSIATWRTERWAGVRTLSPDGQLLASLERGSRINECVVIRRVATGEKVCELPLDGANHRSPIAFSHNGKTVAVSGLGYRYHESDAVRLFDTATGKELRT